MPAHIHIAGLDAACQKRRRRRKGHRGKEFFVFMVCLGFFMWCIEVALLTIGSDFALLCELLPLRARIEMLVGVDQLVQRGGAHVFSGGVLLGGIVGAPLLAELVSIFTMPGLMPEKPASTFWDETAVS